MNLINQHYQKIFTCLLLTSSTLFSTAQSSKEFRVIAIKSDAPSIESASNSVIIEKESDIFIPNAFTPNNDGINDDFTIQANGTDQIELNIFNRYGEVIFTSTSLDKKWDGTYQSKTVPNGVYVYKFLAMNKSKNKWIEREGHVTVIR